MKAIFEGLGESALLNPGMTLLGPAPVASSF